MIGEKSIFTRIIEGEIPCFKVFENDHVYSFLDINPVSRGHVLVIPKEPAQFLHSGTQGSTRGCVFVWAAVRFEFLLPLYETVPGELERFHPEWEHFGS